MSQKYLLAIALGPVQGFITSARRSRDLWYGSFLLSEVSKFVAKSLANDPRVGLDNLIFPSPKDASDLQPNNPLELSVSNKIVAEIEVSENAEIKNLVEKIEKDIRKDLVEKAEAVFVGFKFLNKTTIMPNGSTRTNREIAFEQIENLLEFYWVAVQLDNDNYLASRKKLDALLAARKSTRDFEQPTWASSNFKSALDGQNESVIHKDVFSSNTDEAVLYRSYGIKKGEHLDGVGLFKRHAFKNSNINFYSTSHMAALATLNKITKENKKDLENYIKALKDCGATDDDLGQIRKGNKFFKRNNGSKKGYDARILFKERLVEFIAADKLETAQKALADFLKTLNNSKSFEPHSYYVLMHADGDKMGKAISSITSAKEHRGFSKDLAAFAKGVKTIIESYQGCLIYSGGDDVLAYLPVHKALCCAYEIAEDFKTKLKNYKYDTSKSPTFSVGLVIAHHLEHLEDVLNWSRAAEKIAKNKYNRDALAITLAKRSGVNTTIGGKWTDFYQRIITLIDLYKSGKISHSTAFEIRDFAQGFTNLKAAKQPPAMQDMLYQEASRILGRKIKDDSNTTLAELLKNLKELLANSPEDEDSKKTNYVSALLGFAQEMIIAKEIARSIKHAEGED